MNKIYLVINASDCFNLCVIDICSSQEVANLLINTYKNNFRTANERLSEKELDSLIVIKEVTLNSNIQVLWTMYPYDKNEEVIYA